VLAVAGKLGVNVAIVVVAVVGMVITCNGPGVCASVGFGAGVKAGAGIGAGVSVGVGPWARTCVGAGGAVDPAPGSEVGAGAGGNAGAGAVLEILGDHRTLMRVAQHSVNLQERPAHKKSHLAAATRAVPYLDLQDAALLKKPTGHKKSMHRANRAFVVEMTVLVCAGV